MNLKTRKPRIQVQINKKYFYLVELLFLLIFVSLMQVFLQSGGINIHEIRPHPYWLIILLMSARYGGNSGFLSAISLSLIYISAHDIWIMEKDMFRFTHINEVLKLPLLFTVTSLIIGHFTDNKQRVIAILSTELSEKTATLKELSERYLLLRDKKEKVENRLLSEEKTVFTLYEATKKIETFDLDELHAGILELLENFAHTKQTSLFILNNNKLELTAKRGWSDDSSYPESYSSSDYIFETIIQYHQHLSLKQTQDRDISSDYVLAYPLMLSNGQSYGMVKIEDIDFIDLNTTNIKYIKIILEWAQVSILNALRYQSQKDKNIEDDITGAYSYNYFLERLQKEISLATRYQIPLSILKISLKDYDHFAEQYQGITLNVLGLIFKNMLRDIDIVAHLQRPECFAIILPVTSKEGSKVVTDRVLTEIENFQLRPFTDETLTLEVESEILELEQFKENPKALLEEFTS